MERRRSRHGAHPAGRTKRDHPWHASYGILALLTTLLILNGCDRQGPVEGAGALANTDKHKP